MAYDHALADRVRACLPPSATEQEMFGGIGFLINGNMACGVLGGDLIVRVGADAYDAALEESHVRPFDYTKRPMRGWVYVAPTGLTNEEDLADWVSRSIGFAGSLRAK